jgi:hypothetical protein
MAKRKKSDKIKIEVPKEEVEEMLKKYLYNKVKKELKEEIDQIVWEAKDILIDLKNPETIEKINRRLEKIEDWIKEQDRQFMVG